MKYYKEKYHLRMCNEDVRIICEKKNCEYVDVATNPDGAGYGHKMTLTFYQAMRLKELLSKIPVDKDSMHKHGVEDRKHRGEV